MQLETQKHHYTPEEYLALEEKAEYKSEYRNGEIVPMTGGTTNHNKIALNLAASLKISLRRKNHDVYIGDVRLWIPRYRQHTYPDVMVIQGRANALKFAESWIDIKAYLWYCNLMFQFHMSRLLN